MKKVQDLLIGATYTALEDSASAKIPLSNEGTNGGVGATQAALTAGQLAIVDPEDGLKDAAAGADVFHIAQYDADYGFRLSAPIYNSLITNIDKRTYLAGAKREVSVDFGTPTAGKRYAIIVTETSEEDFPVSGRRRFEITSRNTTEADLYDDFTALINHDDSDVFVAVDGGTEITIQGKHIGVHFDVQAEVEDSDGEMVADSTLVSVSTAGTEGYGTPELLAELESTYQGYMGFNNRIHLPDSPTSAIDSSGTYDLYTIEHKQPLESNNDNDVKGIPIVTVVAIKEAGAAAFETALETVTGVTLA